MATSSKAAVTPSGIRDGEPAALAALVERRANAVLAYCEAVLPRGLADRAAAEAFARFRAAVAAASDPRALDPEGLLLRATRHAAASLTPIPAPPATAGGLRRLVRGSSQDGAVCAQVPDLLAARAEGTLGPADAERLGRHLARHPACQALATAAAAGEAAFATPPARTVPIGALTEIMLALTAAAPITASRAETLDFQAVVEEPEDVRAEAPQDPVLVPAEAIAASPAEPEDVPAGTPPTTLVEPGEVPAATPPAPEELPDAEEHPGALVAPVAAAGAAGGIAHPRPARRHLHIPGAGDHGVLYRFVLPAAVVAAGAVAAMGAAGVFDGGRATRAADTLTAPPSNSPPVTSSTTAQAQADAAAAAAKERRRARAAAVERRRARARARARAQARAEAAAARRRALQTPATGTTAPVTSATTPTATTPAPTAPVTTTPKPSGPVGASTASKSSSQSSSGLPGGGSSSTSGEPGVFQGGP